LDEGSDGRGPGWLKNTKTDRQKFVNGDQQKKRARVKRSSPIERVGREKKKKENGPMGLVGKWVVWKHPCSMGVVTTH